MALTGYDYEEVASYMRTVQEAASLSMETIINQLKNNIVTPASTAWYAPEGVRFFNDFATDVANTKTNIEDIFIAYLVGVKSAANEWERKMEAEVRQYDTTVELDATLDVSAMQESDGSKMGINEAEMNNIAASLDTVESNIRSELSQVSQRLSAESAFLGGTQAEAIVSCFTEINQVVANIFNFLSTHLKPQIDIAVQKYGDMSTAVSTAFSNTDTTGTGV